MSGYEPTTLSDDITVVGNKIMIIVKNGDQEALVEVRHHKKQQLVWIECPREKDADLGRKLIKAFQMKQETGEMSVEGIVGTLELHEQFLQFFKRFMFLLDGIAPIQKLQVNLISARGEIIDDILLEELRTR